MILYSFSALGLKSKRPQRAINLLKRKEDFIMTWQEWCMVVAVFFGSGTAGFVAVVVVVEWMHQGFWNGQPGPFDRR